MKKSPGLRRPREAAAQRRTPGGRLKKQCVVSHPAAKESQAAPIRDLGAHLNAHCKEHRALNQDAPQRAREDLTEDERTIHEQGLVGVLRKPHDWPPGLTPRV